MDHATQYLCLAVLTLPLTVWSLYQTWGVLQRPDLSLTSLMLRLGLVVATSKLSLTLINKFRFHLRARSLGCGSAPVCRSRDPILGLGHFLESLRANRRNKLLELLAARFERHGATYYFLALGRWLLLTNEPENVKAILATRMDDWPIAGPRLLAVLPVLGARSVFSSNGAEWRHARAMIRPAFVRDQVADLRCFERHVGNLVGKMPGDGATFDLQKLLLDMTMDSSTDFMLGYSTNMLTDPSPEARQFIEDFEFASHESARRARLGQILTRLPHRRLDESVERLKRFVRFYLAKAVAEGSEKRAEAKARDYVFLDELLKSGASEQFIVDQILSIIVAGRDTTANAMTAVFWYLARNPDAVAKMRGEIADVGEENPTWEQLRGMRYLNNIIKEALRLCPPVATNARTANKDTVLPRGGGPDGQQPILVPKGTSVRWSLYSMHRRKDIYGPDAEEFRPERWDSDLRVGWEYIPFHGGPRICLGQQFALTQMAYTLYRVFQRFKAIEARDRRPMRLQLSLTASFAYGCLVGMTLA
ncbi:cytochrome P450 [Phialemonium atrogriseum]|uniref:Cytochrome P450 n=1 Tax=Phialemonium atrogriseum TaxID=1093897 RepID=A0AAJ0C286_9PEZI|nr:cytochrome P450 [Phialemonium atrogriseum]KAK1768815.1 cytochrome P450 [Phialemonium atrogriseum]